MAQLTLRPWSEDDLPLLQQLLGDPNMMAHLGGPETSEQIEKRHQRYLHLPETDHMFVVLWGPESEVVGSIGYWEKSWRDQMVYETGWFILPAYQGHGLATKAGEAVLEHARLEHRYQFMHAFPSIDNPASNAICRKLGFTLLGESEFEYPPGHPIIVNDWRFDLFVK